MTIEFIYFDLGRVLLDFTHQRGFEQIAEVTGLTPQRVQEAMVDSGLADQYETGLVSTEDFYIDFCESTDTSAALVDLINAWGDIFDIIPQTLGLACNLWAAGHRVGILSNTCEAHWQFARARFPMLDTIFSPVITSYEEKSMKPDAKIYEAAARAAGVPAERIFFVDDRQENVDGARQAGFQAELFTTPLQLANDLERHGVRFSR